MKYAYTRNIQLTAQNGVNFNAVKEDLLEGLVKYNFRIFSCSIDGSSLETYGAYRVNGNFDRVIQNIKKLYTYKRLYKRDAPRLQ